MCLMKIEECLDRLINSDATMVANQSFYNVLNHVQNSHLNYQVHFSPFSTIISLKKSLVKDKSGRPILPSSFSFAPNEDTEILHDKLLKVESDFSSLQRA